MGETSKIQWNPVRGVELIESALNIPLRRQKPTTYSVNSMSDLFHEALPDETIDRVFAVMKLCPQHTFQVSTKQAERMKDYFRHPHRALLIGIHAANLTLETAIYRLVNQGWPLPNVVLREATRSRSPGADSPPKPL